DGKTLAAFLRYTATAGQELLPGGSYPLPDALNAETSAVAGRIPTTEPPTDDGNHNPGGGNHDPGGQNPGGGFNNGGSGPSGGSPSPKPSGGKPKTTKPVKIAYTNVGASLSSSTPGS